MVVVDITIDENGDVVSAEAVSGPPELHEASVEAARQWKFEPIRVDGEAIKVSGKIVFSFRL